MVMIWLRGVVGARGGGKARSRGQQQLFNMHTYHSLTQTSQIVWFLQKLNHKDKTTKPILKLFVLQV